MQPIRFIDLFAGIGGFHHALHQAGASCVLASEWDPNARKTYLHNVQKIDPLFQANTPFEGDISKIDIPSIPAFDILCGGFPCQPFSNAGQQKGFADPRGNHFFTIAKIIETHQPAAFFLENVRGLINHDNGNTFKTIQRILTEQLGYSFHWKIIKGTDFGVPQHRPRVFMVGFKNPSTPFEFPQPLPLTTTMSDLFGAPCSRKIGFTLRCGGRGSPINDRRNWDRYLVNNKEVQLTPNIAKLMQGLPSDFEFPVSDSIAMKQLGNSVVVPAIAATAAKIIEALRPDSKPKNA